MQSPKRKESNERIAAPRAGARAQKAWELLMHISSEKLRVGLFSGQLAMFILSAFYTFRESSGVPMAILFWSCALAWNVLWAISVRIKFGISVCPYIITAGLISNATACLANGGHMPYLKYPGCSAPWGIHEPINSTSRALPLCDILHGFSIGDVLFLSGILAYFLTCFALWMNAKRATKTSEAIQSC